jgi:hypothetical protein
VRVTTPRSIVLASLALLGAGLLAVAVERAGAAATIAGPDAACRPSPCVAQLRVSIAPVTFRSQQLFYPNNEQISATLTAAGQPLTLRRSWGPGPCQHVYKGAGVSARVKACGPSTPVTVRAVRPGTPKPIGLAITYQASPIMD